MHTIAPRPRLPTTPIIAGESQQVIVAEGIAPDTGDTIAWNYAVLAELMAVGVGLAAGVLPARSAARLDPLEALRSE